jgi:heme o synthase
VGGRAYAALALGSFSSAVGGVAACPSWPLCSADTPAAWLALSHRAAAALATLLVIVAVVVTWRTFAAGLLRQLAVAALALLGAQSAVGAAQAVLAESATVSTVTRLLHIAVGAAAWGVLCVLATRGWQTAPQGASAAVSSASTAATPATPPRWKDYLSLTKPGVISLLILTTVTCMYITPAGIPPLALVAWTFLGGWLMASGAHAVNCYLDQDVDINMGRTARRPIPSGRIPAWHALVLGLVLGVLAFAILSIFVNLLTALLALGGYLFYVFIYTRWLKRTTPSNIVIGGAAGAFPPLVGWAAATGSLTWGALLLFMIIFYWTPPHFWALAIIRRQDYARAGVPMLPVVAGDLETMRQIILYSIQMLVLSIIPALVGMFGAVYAVLAVLFGGLFLYYAIQLRRVGTIASAWSLYKYSLLYLALLFGAMVVDRVWFA